MASASSLITHNHDILVIGAGGAGLMATLSAIRSAEEAGKSFSIACISKVPPTRSHTVAAQGGINAALGNLGEDRWQWHMYDTVRGGDWLGDQDAIAYMCQHAAEAVRTLEQWGVPFSRADNGMIDQRIYGGQSTQYGKGGFAHRACYAADRTGQAILHTLYQQSLKGGCQFFVEYLVLDLLMDEGVCRGALALEIETGVIHVFRAHAVILATGGYGQVYQASTSSSICTGDGNAMVLRAGLPLQDMECVQFHPTGLHGSGLLITEAARGEGGYLLNKEGERFMYRYAPSYGELASRDIIARAMATEIAQKRGCGEHADHLYLSLTHLPKEILEKKLPTVREIAKNFARIDPACDPIPVLPTVHYTMGGIPVSLQGQALDAENTPVPGLYAAGEAACVSVHGANRLGCNSLLDLIVFGKLAAHTAVNGINATSHKPLNASSYEGSLGRLARIRTAKGYSTVASLRKEMKDAMAEHAGVFRTKALLESGERVIHMLYHAFDADLLVRDRGMHWNTEVIEALELENLLLQSIVTLASAHSRKESRGAHYREDHPDRNDKKYLHHILCSLNHKGEPQLTTRPVRIGEGEEEVPSFPPEKRGY
jgi:succinate dehydrogenase / fumarate reductase flavoprotein subunit